MKLNAMQLLPPIEKGRLRVSRSARTTRLINRVLSQLLAVAFGVLLFGCSSPPSAARLESMRTQTAAIAAGDVVRFTFLGAPELNQIQKVRSDGKVNLPNVGEVRVAGRSPGSVQETLAGLYKEHLQDNRVVVTVESSAAVVYVSGAVKESRRVPLDRPMTAFEAIVEAGGFDEGLANKRKVLLVREVNGRRTSRMLDLRPTLGDSSFYVKPYDILIVQERIF